MCHHASVFKADCQPLSGTFRICYPVTISGAASVACGLFSIGRLVDCYAIFAKANLAQDVSFRYRLAITANCVDV